MAAAVASTGHERRHDHAFLSVFPRTDFTTPTPLATPNIGSISSPGPSWGAFDESHIATDDAVTFNRAWSSATRFLALPPGLAGKAVSVDKDILHAFSFLLQSLPAHKDLVAWYTNEIGLHFRNFAVSELQDWQHPIAVSAGAEVLQDTINLLQKIQQHYLSHVDYLLNNARQTTLAGCGGLFKSQIKTNLHALVVHSLPRQRLQNTLASVFFQQMNLSLQAGCNPEKCLKDAQCHCELNLQGLALEELCDVGLGGSVGEYAFAHAVNRFLQGPAIERRCFEVDWHGHASVIPKLRMWVARKLSPLVERALAMLIGNDSLKFTDHDVQQFLSMATSNIGRLRTQSLFDYVKTWPASAGAILDIREYLNATDQADKAHVCQCFTNQVQQRLLHAGASTSEILSIYVNVIHAFKTLDSRGVLLEKVAAPIRNYLRNRDDTVNIIAASFLADVDEDDKVAAADAARICPDITAEVRNSTLESNRDNGMLNWDDMMWMPDPIDAGPDYKASRSEDVVAYVLGLFEQDEFIKEVTKVLAQHLLHATDCEYVKETRLVELFKARLDASKMQAAEVMLKDMRDSVTLGKRINPLARYNPGAVVPTPKEIQTAIPEEGISLTSLWRLFESRMKRPQFLAAVKLVANKRDDLVYAKRTRIRGEALGQNTQQRKEGETNFKAQVLSSFFWPQLRVNVFDMPRALDPLKAQFEHRFHMLGSQRRLQFRPALARVSVRLDLEDRVVEETEVPGWRASVIDAFASHPPGSEEISSVGSDGTAGLTVEQLMQGLNMEEQLVRDALNFWTNKNVLFQGTAGGYAVLERLDMLTNSPLQKPQQASEAVSAVMSQDAMLKESAPMFETFIANMLRNQGPKQIGGMMGITNLLKMVLPSFTYGDEEVLWLLREMQGRGEVRGEGEVWRVV